MTSQKLPKNALALLVFSDFYHRWAPQPIQQKLSDSNSKGSPFLHGQYRALPLFLPPAPTPFEMRDARIKRAWLGPSITLACASRRKNLLRQAVRADLRPGGVPDARPGAARLQLALLQKLCTGKGVNHARGEGAGCDAILARVQLCAVHGNGSKPANDSSQGPARPAPRPLRLLPPPSALWRRRVQTVGAIRCCGSLLRRSLVWLRRSARGRRRTWPSPADGINIHPNHTAVVARGRRRTWPSSPADGINIRPPPPSPTFPPPNDAAPCPAVHAVVGPTISVACRRSAVKFRAAAAAAAAAADAEDPVQAPDWVGQGHDVPPADPSDPVPEYRTRYFGLYLDSYINE